MHKIPHWCLFLKCDKRWQGRWQWDWRWVWNVVFRECLGLLLKKPAPGLLEALVHCRASFGGDGVFPFPVLWADGLFEDGLVFSLVHVEQTSLWSPSFWTVSCAVSLLALFPLWLVCVRVLVGWGAVIAAVCHVLVFFGV